MNYLTARLSILDWSASAGGSHYTGNLIIDDSRDRHCNSWSKKVCRVLSSLDAERLNKKDGARGFGYKAGELTDRFDSKQLLVNAALELISQHFPTCRLEGREWGGAESVVPRRTSKKRVRR